MSFEIMCGSRAPISYRLFHIAAGLARAERGWVGEWLVTVHVAPVICLATNTALSKLGQGRPRIEILLGPNSS